MAPVIKPFFFIFLVPNELPIKILIPVTVIITGLIVSSDKFVYVKSTSVDSEVLLSYFIFREFLDF